MPFTLTVRKVDRPAAAAPPPLRLDGRGAVIGRAAGSDWVLPDERNTVSSRHCEIAFRDGAYWIADSSTNGTYVNGRKLAAPQRLNDGDVIGVGPYEIVAGTAAEPATAIPAAEPAAPGGPADHLLRHAGVRRADVRGSDAEILAAAGTLLSRVVAGLALLLADRARARAELGAAPPPPSPFLPAGGGQPLAALLTPSAEQAAAKAVDALQAHQLATLKAMHGAMKATLERFSPAAIRTRAGAKANEAALWQEYEAAFAASAGDNAFIEVFARELRAAYEALAKERA